MTWLTYTEQGMIEPLLYRHVDLDLCFQTHSAMKLFYCFDVENTPVSPKASWIHTLCIDIARHIIHDKPTLTQLRKDSIALITRSTGLRELRLDCLLDKEDLKTIASCHSPALTKLSVCITWNSLPLLRRFPALKDLQLQFHSNNPNDTELQNLFRSNPFNDKKFARGVTLPNLRELVAFVNLANTILVEWLTHCNLPMFRKMVFMGGYRTLPHDHAHLLALVSKHGLGLGHFGFGADHMKKDSETPKILFHMPSLSILEMSTPLIYGFHLEDLPVAVTQIVLCGFYRQDSYKDRSDFLSAAKKFDSWVE